MSNRAEQAALSAYPPTYTTVKKHAKRVQSERTDTHRPARAIFQYGYEQAEKDLALSWEDMNKIYHIIQALIKEAPNYSYADGKDFFEEVLRRFLEIC